MVDVYHLTKLCINTAKVLKASHGAYNAVVIFKSTWKSIVGLGVGGMIDSACEELVDKLIEEKTNGNS